MKKNNFIQTILYKILKESILITQENETHDLIINESNYKINELINILDNIAFNNQHLNLLRDQLLDELKNLNQQKVIDVYSLWNIQSKIDMLLVKGKLI